ncbi:TPA: hypothetical protein N0F65_004415 [Lagenidium giganteum]|uniref:Secreted protein n=1 Tax=Lagenidium giganteum TaxID=4803 RepID=A0AAV2ZCN0_9STRA|nr:TPA: hypothetical protein N0F65_004415 [Lagenidium giganteum]
MKTSLSRFCATTSPSVWTWLNQSFCPGMPLVVTERGKSGHTHAESMSSWSKFLLNIRGAFNRQMLPGSSR